MLSAILFFPLLLPAFGLSLPQKRDKCTLTAPDGGGEFTRHETYRFEGTILLDNQLSKISEVSRGSIDRVSDPSLATVKNYFLNLKVPGGQTESLIRGGAVRTYVEGMQYASVRTMMEFSSVPGTAQSKIPTSFVTSDFALRNHWSI
jgi:hypothetical protein